MKTFAKLLGLALLACAPAAPAAIDALDNVPAATLLLPYFEIDTAPNGRRTVVTLGNASPTEQLAHVTLWTDRGVATYSFDVRLPGYGVTEIDLHALFADGTLPASSAGGFASCAATLPPAPVAGAQLTGLRNAHTGAASSLLGGQCGGTSHGDGRARGYATIDVVGSCGTAVPGDAGYFVLGGNGIARNDNVLWGEQATIEPASGVAYGDTLVHIEASATAPATDGTPTPDPNPGNPPLVDYTFYGRLVGASGADNREGLPGAYVGRYSLQDAIVGTTAQVWRDPGAVAPFACGSPPPDLGSPPLLAFDQQEQFSQTAQATFAPYATQSIDLGNPSQAAIPFGAGFVAYNLYVSGADPLFENRNQAFVSHVYTANFGGTGQTSARAIGPITSRFNQSPANGFTFPQCSDGIDNDGDGDIDFPDDTTCPTAEFQFESTECSDGIDNDGDGNTDHPADAGCVAPYSQLEAPECSDGADNDGDTQIDFGSDTFCVSPADQFEADFNNQCSDGIDNDGDGLVDFVPGAGDPDCFNPGDSTEYAGLCSDGIDNDGDGFTDFPDDMGCFAPNDNDETDPVCSDGIDNDGDGFTDFPDDVGCANAGANTEAPACNDGIDNDGDGNTDFPADNSCAAASFPTETTACSDGIDNDGDTLIDFPADPSCQSAAGTSEFAPPLAQCSDGIDNDGDGLADFPLSPGCTAANDDFEGPDCSDGGFDNDFDGLADNGSDPGCAGADDYNELANATTRACSDGIDNDGDGASDYPADAGCESAWDDVEYTPTGSVPVIVLQPATLPDADGGVPYAQVVTASGGIGPYSFLVLSGTLPAGLALAPDGTLSGTPTEAGAFAITIQATDSNSFSGTRDYVLQVIAPVIELGPMTLPDGDAGVPYSEIFSATGGTAPHTFALSAGTLPAGLTLAADGTLSGTPTVAGTFAITVEATDANGFTGTRDYSLVIDAALIDVAPATLPDADGGVAYSQTITASGGTAPYTFALVDGALPDGLTLAPDGTLEGTPTAAGTFGFTIEATDANAFTGARAYTVTVSGPAIAIAPGTLPDGSTGQAYEVIFTASGGLAPYTFALVDGALPPGLTLSADGLLTGGPTAPGNYVFTLEVTDANGFTAQQAYGIVVVPGTPQAVPAVIPAASGWSLMLLLLALGSVAFVMLRRR
ncbi:Ig domain-containing protein [Chiayiivirga flava]|uniref:IPTL-CTERM protein sorting domain-containing protein n=1 Tax=Chiayiivirga flava TaxID=659595 RepID=A0A7W8FZH1_9GAMM|nr:Ig domain-containing protein [Chiayiivirga flava]MBB5208447.1 hypothetical protein [Chiayiivirga flava]